MSSAALVAFGCYQQEMDGAARHGMARGIAGMHDRQERKRKASGNEATVVPLAAAKGGIMARQGAPTREQEVIRSVLPRVRQVVRMVVRADAEADDIVNICLLEILKALPSYRAEGSLEAWAGSITYRVVMRHLKGRRLRERTVALEPEIEVPSDAGPDDDMRRLALRERLLAHLAALPLERRLTIVLRLAFGHSVDEVAELTGAPRNTVRDRIRVALRELRVRLAGDQVVTELMAEKSDD